MDATYGERDRRRAERWVDHSDGLGYVPPEAFGLLIRRLAARRRIAVWCSPLLVLSFGILASLILDVVGSADDVPTDETSAYWTLAAGAAAAVALVVMNQLNGHVERRIGETLPHRVSRSAAVSVPTMLGPVRMAFLVSALTLEAALAVALLLLQQSWLAWTFPLAFAVGLGFVVLGIRRASTRPTVAVDPVSLAIDERLRSADAFSATFPLFFLLIAFSATTMSSSIPRWLGLAWTVGSLPLFGLWVWGQTSGPWRARSAQPGAFFARALSRVRS